jgi:hypothetical protein
MYNNTSEIREPSNSILYTVHSQFYRFLRQSQLPRRLEHELSSPAEMRGSGFESHWKYECPRPRFRRCHIKHSSLELCKGGIMSPYNIASRIAWREICDY